MIIDQYTDIAGKVRITWQLPDGNAVMWKFQTEPTTQQLEDLEAQHLVIHEYDDVPQIPIIIMEDVKLITNFILLVKDNPTVNLTQFNNWLSTKEWYEDAQIRIFIFKLAQGLSSNYDVELDDYTITEVLIRVRDWIVTTPINKIKKIILGE